MGLRRKGSGLDACGVWYERLAGRGPVDGGLAVGYWGTRDARDNLARLVAS